MYKLSLLLINLFVICLAYGQRKTSTINEVWRFHKGDIGDVSANIEDKNWEIVTLPHTWNADDAAKIKDYYRGIGWYRKNLSYPFEKGKKYFLHFEGSLQLTDIYINGKKAGSHTGGYTAFTIDISNFLNYNKSSPNILSVKVDNSYNENIAPLNADFTFWGGIYRDVYLVESNMVHFSYDNYGSAGIFVETPKVSAKEATVKLRSDVRNEENYSKTIRIIAVIKDPAGKIIQRSSEKATIRPGGNKTIELQSQTITDPQLWSPNEPNLYYINTQIIDSKKGTILDEQEVPLGLRWFSVDTSGFKLNGENIKLIGAARHQDFKGIGNALSNDLNYRDIKLLKEMGANFIRISHYPQDPSVLDACDRLGLVVWEEIPIVNRITLSKEFADNSKNMLKEMIRQNFNHPSVLIWAYSNEVMIDRKKDDATSGYDPALIALHKELEDLTRKEDPYRITSIAFHGNTIYNQVGMGEIPMTVGWNLYNGWYGKDLSDFSKFLNEQHDEYPNRPLFISEYGAGSDKRLHSTNPEKFDFSMEYQQLLHEYYLPQIEKRPYVVGASLWNLVDFGVASRQESMPRVNNKGILYQNRDKKDVYYYYQSSLLKKPVLYIASRDWDHRAGIPATENENFVIQPVKIYSNIKEAELFLNGKSLGKKNILNSTAVFNVPFVNGRNLVEVKGKLGDGQLISDFLYIDFEIQPYNLKNSDIKNLQIAVNAGSNCFFTDDKSKLIYFPDQLYRKGSWGYIEGNDYRPNPGRPGIQSEITATDNDPLFQISRENVKAYQFDIPDGTYELELFFCEPVYNTPKSLYDIGTDTNIKESKRVFDVILRGC